MTLAGAYPWLKGLHVASALVFVGGLFSVSAFLRLASAESSVGQPTARAVRRWDQAVTIPAMLLTWTLGLTLALSGGWLTEGWLQAKVVLVVILSGLHGVQSGRLRRLAGGASSQPSRLSPAIFVCVVAIAILAAAKPF